MNRDEFELTKSNLYNAESNKDAINNPIITLFLSLCPPVGDTFKNVINGVLETKITNNRNKLFDIILDGSSCVTTDMIYDVELLTNFSNTVEAVDRLATNDKIVYFGNLLRNGYFNGEKIQADKYEEYFNAISSLSYRQLSLLALLYSHNKNRSDDCDKPGSEIEFWNTFKEDACNRFDLSEGELVSILKATEKTGLCKEFVGSVYNYLGGRFEATPILNDFATFVFDKGNTNT